MQKATPSEDEPIVHRMITRSLETAQKRIEGFNFDARKRILAYDDVLNHQRQAVYERRARYLTGDRVAMDAFLGELASDGTVASVIAEKRELLGEDEFYAIVRRLLLQTIDLFWLEHLEVMEHLRGSVNLRAYGQRDPLVEYRKEGLRMYRTLEASIAGRVADMLPQIGAGAFVSEEERMRRESERAQRAVTTGDTSVPPRTQGTADENKYGRNELVTITNGSDVREVKYKKAEPLLASGLWKVVER